MQSFGKQALRLIAIAAMLTGPTIALAQQATPADTTSKAQKQAGAAERHIAQAIGVVHQLDMDDRMRSLLTAAKGVFIVPSYGRAAIGLGAEGGAGILLVKQGDSGWSQPVFYNTGGLSIGLQAGAQGGMLVFVLNNQKAVDAFLKKTSVSLNAKAGLTVLNWNKMAQGSLGTGDIVAWSDTKGLFGDVATVELNGIRYNQKLNDAYYHRTLSASDIIAGKTSNAQADLLVQALASSTER
jgi:lipid-binding SYLF domain-containing protein